LSQRLTKTDILERLHSQTLESYALIANVAKGIALGAASIALLEIVAAGGYEWLRLLPWIASLELLVLTYMKWVYGILLSSSRSNIGDIIYPFVMAVTEFILFGILFVEDDKGGYRWLGWLVVYITHGVVSFLIVSNRRRLLMDCDFENDMKELCAEARSWMTADRVAIGVSVSVATITWIVGHVLVLPCSGPRVWSYVVAGFALFASALLWKPIRDTSAQRARIDRFVSLLDAEATQEDTPP
jgi:hypothetical protein